MNKTNNSVTNNHFNLKYTSMKNLKNFAAILMLLFIAGSISAQTAKTKEISIKVSSQCNKCKETIEKTLAFEKGIVKSEVDIETSTVKVTYKPSKTTPEAIRKAISMAGYDADNIAADPKAYSRLSDCCKKPADRQSMGTNHNN